MATCSHGSKFFWRTRNNIDVTIVSHYDLETVEVIAYEPSVDVEAERHYLNLRILNSKLNQEEIEAKFSFAKQNNVAHSEQFETEVVNRATSDFILNHLFIKEYSKDDRKFAVQLQFGDDDYDAHSRLIRDKPTELVPFETQHYKLFTNSEVSAALRALEDEQTNLEEQCTKAIEMNARANIQLSHKERWRIPIVLGKLAKCKNLSETDDKIWSAVSSNLKTQQDIDKLTKVALRIVTPSRPVTPIRNDSQSQRSRGYNGTSTPTRSPCITPNRSPCGTPRLTPRATSLSRASSQRLFNGTISSQNRALTFAGEETASSKLPRKLSKRGSSMSGSKAPKHRGSKSRTPTSTSTNATNLPSPGALDSGIATVESDETTSLIGQVAAGIVNLAASFSAKVSGKRTKKHAAETEIVTDKSAGGVTITGEDGVNPEQEVSGQSPLDRTCLAPMPVDAAAGAAAGGGSENNRVKPSKRRSFFGSLFASLTGSSSTKYEPTTAPTTVHAAEGVGANAGTEDQPAQKVSPKKTDQKHVSISRTSAGHDGKGSKESSSLSAALAAWFPWSQSAPVVPVDLPEYVPPELC